MTPFHQENEDDTRNFVLNSPVIFPSDSIKLVSDECKEMIRRLVEKDVGVRAGYQVEEFRKNAWIRLHLESNSADDTIFEAEEASAHEEYQKTKGKKFDGIFVDSFSF